MSLTLDILLAPVAVLLLISLARLFADATKPYGKPRYCRDLYRTFHP